MPSHPISGLSPSWNAKDMAAEIMSEVYRACEKLGACSDLLGCIGSFRDTLSDEEVLEELRQFNATGSVFTHVVAEIDPATTPQPLAE